MEKPIIYGTPDCPYCNQLKDILRNENIEFKDVDVNLSENQKEYEQLCEITKSDMVPIIRINKHLLVPDVSFKSISEASNLIKRFLTENN